MTKLKYTIKDKKIQKYIGITALAFLGAGSLNKASSLNALLPNPVWVPDAGAQQSNQGSYSNFNWKDLVQSSTNKGEFTATGSADFNGKSVNLRVVLTLKGNTADADKLEVRNDNGRKYINLTSRKAMDVDFTIQAFDDSHNGVRILGTALASIADLDFQDNNNFEGIKAIGGSTVQTVKTTGLYGPSPTQTVNGYLTGTRALSADNGDVNDASVVLNNQGETSLFHYHSEESAGSSFLSRNGKTIKIYLDDIKLSNLAPSEKITDILPDITVVPQVPAQLTINVAPIEAEQSYKVFYVDANGQKVGTTNYPDQTSTTIFSGIGGAKVGDTFDLNGKAYTLQSEPQFDSASGEWHIQISPNLPAIQAISVEIQELFNGKRLNRGDLTFSVIGGVGDASTIAIHFTGLNVDGNFDYDIKTGRVSNVKLLHSTDTATILSTPVEITPLTPEQMAQNQHIKDLESKINTNTNIDKNSNAYFTRHFTDANGKDVSVIVKPDGTYSFSGEIVFSYTTLENGQLVSHTLVSSQADLVSKAQAVIDSTGHSSWVNVNDFIQGLFNTGYLINLDGNVYNGFNNGLSSSTSYGNTRVNSDTGILEFSNNGNFDSSLSGLFNRLQAANGGHLFTPIPGRTNLVNNPANWKELTSPADLAQALIDSSNGHFTLEGDKLVWTATLDVKDAEGNVIRTDTYHSPKDFETAIDKAFSSVYDRAMCYINTVGVFDFKFSPVPNFMGGGDGFAPSSLTPKHNGCYTYELTPLNKETITKGKIVISVHSPMLHGDSVVISLPDNNDKKQTVIINIKEKIKQTLKKNK